MTTSPPMTGAGSLQARRGLPDQDAALFSVEERVSLDWLHVWQEQCRQLRFFGGSDPDTPAQSWEGLLPGKDDWPALAAWLEQGTPLPPELASRAARPDLALLLVWLRLQRHPRAAFAALTEAHRQYHYQQQLFLSPRAGTPDEADVILTLAEGAAPQRLAAGTRFSGGLDANGVEAEYASLDPLPLGSALLRRALTLGQQASNGNAKLLRRACLDAGASLDWPAGGSLAFGETTVQDSKRDAYFAPGLRLVSPLLWLSGGQRAITLTLGGGDADAFAAQLASLAQGNELPRDTFNRLWLAEFSGAEKAQTVAASALSHVPGNLQIIWALDAGAPAIAAPAGSTPYLALRLNLQKDANGTLCQLPGLDGWQQLRLQNLTLSVAVNGLAPEAVRNSGGVVDVSSPFDAFPGPISAGHALGLGHREWLLKPLSALSIALRWEGRPQDLAGYYALYQKYRQSQGKTDSWPAPQLQLTLGADSRYRADATPQPILQQDEETLSFALGASIHSQSAWPTPQAMDELPSDPQAWPGHVALAWRGEGMGHAEEAAVNAWLAGRYTAALLDWTQRAQDGLSVRTWADQSGVRLVQASLPAAGWSSTQTGEQWLGPEYNHAFTATDFTITLQGACGQTPTLQGSNDRRNWDILHTLDTSQFTPGVAYKATLPAAASYRYYRYHAAAGTADALKITAFGLTAIDPEPLPLPDILPEPHTPRLAGLTLGYQGRIDLSTDAAADHALLSLWHEHPFGLVPQLPRKESQNATPSYGLIDNDYRASSVLYLGFSALSGQGELTLRPDIQPQDGSGGEVALTWYACDAEQQWQALLVSKQGQQEQGAALLADQSNDLHNSGIVRLNLPALWQDADGLSWLAVRHAPGAAGLTPPTFARLLRLDPHVVRVRYQGADDSHLAQSLPAGRIAALLPPQSAVATVVQPAPSQGGHPGEDGAAFAIRAAERINHRGRALLARDYERLVLDAFPGLALARARRDGQGVRLIVAPQPEDPALLQPQPSRKLREDIKTLLMPRMPPGLTPTITAPRYWQYRLICHVVLDGSYDIGRTLFALNSRLVAFLSPWQGKQTPGSRLYLSDASRFLAQQPEVLQVVALRLETLGLEPGSAANAADGIWHPCRQPWLEASQGDTLLVPAEQHVFQRLDDAGAIFEGLGAMTLELDFLVSADPIPFLPAPLADARVGQDLAISP